MYSTQSSDLTLKKDEILINESLLNYKITYFKDSLLNQPILKPEKYINSFQIEKKFSKIKLKLTNHDLKICKDHYNTSFIKFIIFLTRG